MAKVGAPLKFKTVEELEGKIEAYFNNIEETGKPPTITGLALYLGFLDRQSIYDYKAKPQFAGTIKKARLRIEALYEQNLHGTHPTGSIFALKNFGWRDKHEIEAKVETRKAVSLDELEGAIHSDE